MEFPDYYDKEISTHRPEISTKLECKEGVEKLDEVNFNSEL